MNDVLDPRKLDIYEFWKALQSWVKRLVLVIGLFFGIAIWFSIFTPAWPVLALIYLGSGTPALVLQVLVALVLLAVLVGIIWMSERIIKLVIYFSLGQLNPENNQALIRLIYKNEGGKNDIS